MKKRTGFFLGISVILLPILVIAWNYYENTTYPRIKLDGKDSKYLVDQLAMSLACEGTVEGNYVSINGVKIDYKIIRNLSPECFSKKEDGMNSILLARKHNIDVFPTISMFHDDHSGLMVFNIKKNSYYPDCWNNDLISKKFTNYENHSAYCDQIVDENMEGIEKGNFAPLSEQEVNYYRDLLVKNSSKNRVDVTSKLFYQISEDGATVYLTTDQTTEKAQKIIKHLAHAWGSYYRYWNQLRKIEDDLIFEEDFEEKKPLLVSENEDGELRLHHSGGIAYYGSIHKVYSVIEPDIVNKVYHW